MREKCKPLQSVRALLFVLLYMFHAGIPYTSILWIGVEIFFVISGYFIFDNLLKKGNRSSLGKMAFLRIKRLYWPHYLIVVVLCILFGYWQNGFKNTDNLLEPLSFLTGMNNIFWIKNPLTLCSTLGHLWTVAIEIQAIIIIAFIVFVLRSLRISDKWAILLLICSSIGYVLFVPYYYRDIYLYSLLPFGHLVNFGIGGLVAILRKRMKPSKAMTIGVGTLGIVGIIVICCYISSKQNVSFFTALFSMSTATPNILQGRIMSLLYCFIGLVGASIVMFCYELPQNTLLYRLMSNSIVVSIGDNSYLLYLWHYPLLRMAKMLFSQRISLWCSSIVVFGITFLCAYMQKNIYRKLIRR